MLEHMKHHTEELDDNLPVRYVTCCYHLLWLKEGVW